jgi:hypothetical protein
VSGSRAAPGSPRAAAVFGGLVGFVTGVDLVRLVRVDVLLDPDPSWALPRLLLTLGVVMGAVAAAALAATGFLAWSRTPSAGNPLHPLALGRATLATVAFLALAFGVAARFAWLARIPSTVWYDEILPIAPSLALSGRTGDFADSIRVLWPAHAAVGVLYLEGFRTVLHVFGTNVFSMRFAGALEGSLSIVTAMLLARALLPRGGVALTALALAGLRWQLIIARFGWNGLALAPIVDLATLALIRARRRSSLAAAAAGGLIAGLGAHVYLGAWIAIVGLGGFVLWPTETAVPLRRRIALGLVVGLGFLATASPIFLLKQGRERSYFVRASDQSLMKDIVRRKSWLVPFEVVADSVQAPWLVPDPDLRQDLPVSRLGWILGVPFALTVLCAFARPKRDLSALLFAHAGAALLACLRWGAPGHPNGFRFVYLSTLTAVAAAAGALCLLGLLAPPHRRAGAFAALGLFAIGAALGARDAVLRWGQARTTFVAYWGESTLIGRAALRWERYGPVRIDVPLPHSSLVIDAVREYALDPDAMPPAAAMAKAGERCFRIVEAAIAPAPDERRVETIRDAWGEPHGQVLARGCGAASP